MASVANTKLLSVKINGHSAWDGVYVRDNHTSELTVYRNYLDATNTKFLTIDPSGSAYVYTEVWSFYDDVTYETVFDSDFDDVETVPSSNTIAWTDALDDPVTVSISVISGVEISTPDELQAIGYDNSTLDGDYIQTQNIEMNVAPYRSADGFGGFRPIGTDANPFTGTYNGKNFEIQHLFIDRSIDSCGLFGRQDGSLSNIYIKGVNIKNSIATGSNTAALAALPRGPVTNCRVEGIADWKTILQDSNANVMHMAGGLFANGDYGVTTAKVSGCNVMNIDVENKSVGAASTTGGFIGQSATAAAMAIEKCCVCNNSTVTGRSVGGFAGVIARDSKITDCFTRATPTSNHASGYSGGFCGVYFNAGVEITRCYAQNTPAGTGTLAAFCAWEHTAATVANSFYQGTGTQAGATGLSEANMKIAGSFTGWNFNTLWNIGTDNNGYPYLDRRYSGIPSRFGIVGVIR